MLWLRLVPRGQSGRLSRAASVRPMGISVPDFERMQAVRQPAQRAAGVAGERSEQRSLPLAVALQAWQREHKLSAKSETAKAVDYRLKRWA
ncbi:MAG: hypothetical protein ABSC37_01305 [Xanthobacteraceae bacterium]